MEEDTRRRIGRNASLITDSYKHRSSLTHVKPITTLLNSKRNINLTNLRRIQSERRHRFWVHLKKYLPSNTEQSLVKNHLYMDMTFYGISKKRHFSGYWNTWFSL